MNSMQKHHKALRWEAEVWKYYDSLLLTLLAMKEHMTYLIKLWSLAGIPVSDQSYGG